jgi:hypothetical protein
LEVAAVVLVAPGVGIVADIVLVDYLYIVVVEMNTVAVVMHWSFL